MSFFNLGMMGKRNAKRRTAAAARSRTNISNVDSGSTLKFLLRYLFAKTDNIMVSIMVLCSFFHTDCVWRDAKNLDSFGFVVEKLKCNQREKELLEEKVCQRMF